VGINVKKAGINVKKVDTRLLHINTRLHMCLSVCLSNSKMNDPKVFKLGTGNDFGKC